MKLLVFIKFVLLTGMLSMATVSGNEFRTWITAKKELSECKFEKYGNGHIGLRDKAGAQIILKAEELSVVDRLYLIDEHEVPEAELLKGYEPQIELKYVAPKDQFTKGEPITMKFGDDELKFKVIETPHFQILSEKTLITHKVGSYFERMWFYHSYRNPLITSQLGNKKVVVYITSTKDFAGLCYDHLNSSNHKSEQSKQSWLNSKNGNISGVPIPREYFDIDRFMRLAYLIRLDELDFFGDENFRLTAAYAQFLMRYCKLDMDMSRLGEGQYFVYGIGFDAEMTFHEEILSGFSVDGIGSHAWGKSREWSKDLTTAARKGELDFHLEDFYTENVGRRGSPLFGHYVTAVAMFLRSDMSKEIGTARFLKMLAGKKEFPALDEIIQCYGYKNVSDMEADLMKFLSKRSIK